MHTALAHACMYLFEWILAWSLTYQLVLLEYAFAAYTMLLPDHSTYRQPVCILAFIMQGMLGCRQERGHAPGRRGNMVGR